MFFTAGPLIMTATFDWDLIDRKIVKMKDINGKTVNYIIKRLEIVRKFMKKVYWIGQ